MSRRNRALNNKKKIPRLIINRRKPKKNRGPVRFSKNTQFRGMQRKLGRNPYRSQANNYNNFGQFPTQMAPRTIGTRFTTSTRVMNDGIVAVVQIPQTNFGGVTAAIPVSPLCYTGRIFDTAKNFTFFKVVRSSLHYVPIRGTDEGGNVIIAGQPHSVEVTQGANYVDQLTQIGASISPVWTPVVLPMPKDNEKYPVLPNISSHMPYNYFVGIKDGEGAHALAYWGDFYLEVCFKFIGTSTHSNIVNTPVPLTFNFAAGGVTTTANTTGTTKLVVSISTCTNIDVGEFVIIPTITAFAVPALLSITHNGELINYAAPADQGTVTGMCFVEN